MACDADDMFDEEYERYVDPIIDEAIANFQFDDEYHIVPGALLGQRHSDQLTIVLQIRCRRLSSRTVSATSVARYRTAAPRR